MATCVWRPEDGLKSQPSHYSLVFDTYKKHILFGTFGDDISNQSCLKRGSVDPRLNNLKD